MFRLRGFTEGQSLKRAALEFLVIVIGVLVALAGDQWRQEREEARELNAYLVSVLGEVQSNLTTIRLVRSMLTVLKIPALETVIAYLGSDDTTVEDPDELLRAFAASGGTAVPWLTRSRFEALRNSGLLRQLPNDEYSLADTLSGTYQAPQVLLDQVDLIQGEFPVAVNEYIPAGDQPQLNRMRGYAATDAQPPAVAIDINPAEAIALINRDRERLLRLARGEVAVATATWYALARLDEAFTELEKDLAEQLGIELPPREP